MHTTAQPGDATHLQALLLNLSHERGRLSRARSEPERQLRAVWVAQLEREVSAEEAFLRRTSPLPEVIELDDDALLRALLDD